jgi:hypothetical protein
VVKETFKPKFSMLLVLSILVLMGFVAQGRALTGGDILIVGSGSVTFGTFTTVAAATGTGFTTTVVDYSAIAPIDAGDLAGYEILVLESPKTTLTADEVTTITSFVSGGGGLIVMNDWDSSTTTNPLTSGYGVTIWDTGVPTSTGEYLFSAHPILAGVSYIDVVEVPEVPPPGPYAEWDGALTVTSPATAIAWLDDTPIIAVSGPCVIIIAENEQFSDGWGVENPDNQLLLQNMLLWLNMPPEGAPEFELTIPLMTAVLTALYLGISKRYKK